LTKWIVDADLLDEAAVAGAAAIGDNDAVERSLLAASASESKSYGHWRATLEEATIDGNPGKDSRKRVLIAQLRVK
jgi:hypothetical protein